MMSNTRLVFMSTFLLSCNITFLTFLIKYLGNNNYIMVNNVSAPFRTLPDTFLSVGIDTSMLLHLDKLNLKSEKLITLASFLSPGYLRFGGTLSDRLIFDKNHHTSNAEHTFTSLCGAHHHSNRSHVCKIVNKLLNKKDYPIVMMNGRQLMAINEFCQSSNLNLLFTLNVLLRNGTEWDNTNALDIINFSKFHKYTTDWQLGNEPNSFHHVFNISISPEQLASDFKTLRNTINSNGYGNALLVGPDTTRPQPNRPDCLQYMIDFLAHASDVINVRAWHQYYLNSRTAKLDDFWNPDTFDLLKDQIKVMKENTEVYNWMPMWLSETSSSYGGGAPGLSDSFAGSPLWLDKLGLSALYNISTVVRQSLIGGNYSLIDKELNPNPDWWVSMLFKKLVGNKVLQIKYNSSKYQRIYCHCTNKKYTNSTSSITIFGLNLQFAKIHFPLNGTAFWPVTDILRDEFLLTAPSLNRKTKVVLLNGRQLLYKDTMPKLRPRLLRYGKHITMPPYSIGFWVIKNTTLTIC